MKSNLIKKIKWEDCNTTLSFFTGVALICVLYFGGEHIYAMQLSILPLFKSYIIIAHILFFAISTGLILSYILIPVLFILGLISLYFSHRINRILNLLWIGDTDRALLATKFLLADKCNHENSKSQTINRIEARMLALAIRRDRSIKCSENREMVEAFLNEYKSALEKVKVEFTKREVHELMNNNK